MTEPAIPTVTFERKVEDYEALRNQMERAFWRTSAGLILRYGSAVGGGAAAVLLMLAIPPLRDVTFVLQIIFVLTLFFGFRWMIWAAAMVLLPSRLFAPGERYAATLSVSILPDGLRTVGTEGEGTIPWSAFRDMSETPSHFFLALDNVRLIPIPKRAFGNAVSAKAFHDALRERLKVA